MIALFRAVSGAALLTAMSLSVQSGTGARAAGSANDPKTAHSALTIHLERLRGQHIEPMRPDHVFDPGDVLRFRLTSGMEGFLYVLNQGSSGSYSVLFPAPGSTATNEIHTGADYLVPSIGDGWFQIEGPAGFDTVYFLLSPTALGVSAAAPSPGSPGTQVPPSSLKPRCNDAVFQARGECVDSTAGPAPLARGAAIPAQITAVAPRASRDIVLVTDQGSDTVQVSTKTDGPVVYTFRLAHH